MTKNSKRKNQIRETAAAAGSNYTTALRQRVTPVDAVVAAVGIQGALGSKLSNGLGRQEALALVREDLYVFASYSGRARHEDLAQAASRHYTAVKVALELHSGIEVSTEYLSWRHEFAYRSYLNLDTGASSVSTVLNVPIRPSAAGSVTELHVTTRFDGNHGFTIEVSADASLASDISPDVTEAELERREVEGEELSAFVYESSSWALAIEQSADELRAPEANQSSSHGIYRRGCWADDRGLVLGESDDPICKIGTIGKSDDHECWPNCRVHNVLQGSSDHFNVYRDRTTGEPVAITSYPYPRGTDNDWIHFDASDAAMRFGLSYRMGDPADDMYGRGTVPVVLWNPDRAILV